MDIKYEIEYSDQEVIVKSVNLLGDSYEEIYIDKHSDMADIAQEIYDLLACLNQHVKMEEV